MNIILLIALAAIFFSFLIIVFRKKSQCKPPITVLTRKFYNSILCYNSLACGWRKIVSFFKRFFHVRGGLRGEGMASGRIKNKKSCGALPLRAKKFAIINTVNGRTRKILLNKDGTYKEDQLYRQACKDEKIFILKACLLLFLYLSPLLGEIYLLYLLFSY